MMIFQKKNKTQNNESEQSDSDSESIMEELEEIQPQPLIGFNYLVTL